MKKLFTTLLMLFTIMMMSIPASAQLIKVPKKLYIEYSADGWTHGDRIESYYNRFPIGCKIKNIKVSNTKVVKAYPSKMHYVSSEGEQVHPYLQIDGLSKGSCTVSFDVVRGKTKEHHSVKIYSKKYENPIASLTINGKEYAPSMKNLHYLIKSFKNKTNYKIKIKAKKGWKLKGIYNYDNWDITYKNGGIVRFNGGKNHRLSLYFVNTKTKKEKILWIGKSAN